MEEDIEDCDAEALLEFFFSEHLVFYTATEDIWDYDHYLNSCVIGGELNDMQYVDGVFFVSDGRSLHICGTDDDLKAFKLFMQWAYSPDFLEFAYPCISIPWDDPITDEREIIQFYHCYRQYYAIAPYYAFREYLKSIVPKGVMIFRDHQFYFVNDSREYLVGLYGETTLFEKWCKENHAPYSHLGPSCCLQPGDEFYEEYQQYRDILETIGDDRKSQDDTKELEHRNNRTVTDAFMEYFENNFKQK